MRLMVGFFFFLLVFSNCASAQTVHSGMVPGTWNNDQASWAWYADLSAPPLMAGRISFHLAAGQSLMDWEALDTDAIWAGWRLSGESWTSLVATAQVSKFSLATHWEEEQFNWDCDPIQAVFSLNQIGPVQFGAGVLEAKGRIRYHGSLILGDFLGRARSFFLGVPGVSLFYGEASADFSANFGLGILSPFRLEGAFQVKTLGFWAQKDWTEGEWSWGLGLGGGLLWANQGTWKVTREWFEFSWQWPFSIKRTAFVNYQLEAEPAWGLLFNPRIRWRFHGGGPSLVVSRWIPVTGGSTFAKEGEPPPPAESSSRSLVDSLSQTDARNLWFAGLQIQVSYQW